MDEDAAQALAYQLEIEHRWYEEDVLNLCGEEKDGGEFDVSNW